MSRRPSSPEGTCRDCNAPIFWAEMPNGKKRPVDREPVQNGTIVLFKRPDGSLRGEYVRRGQRPNAPARRCHFDTCTERQQQRRGAQASRPQQLAQGGGAARALGKVVSVQVLVKYEDGTVLRFQPQSIAEVVRAAGAQQRRSA